jgi:menaquinone-dependent protoporphyrinogen oxidase
MILMVLCASAQALPRTPDDLIETSCGENSAEGLRVLIAYDTIHGSTAEVAEYIGTVMCGQGWQADVRLAANVSGIAGYDAVIIGSAVYEFQWLPDAAAFVERNHAELERVPTAYFIVCSAMYADSAESRAAVTRAFIDPVLKQFPDIVPLSIGLFGGAVDFKTNQYTFFEAVVLRILGFILGFIDSADWRNWDAISTWAGEAADALRFQEPATAATGRR